MGALYIKKAEFDKALEYLKQALMISGMVGNRLYEPEQLCYLGVTLENKKSPKEALACYLLAERIYEETRISGIHEQIKANIDNLKKILGEDHYNEMQNEVHFKESEIIEKIVPNLPQNWDKPINVDSSQPLD